MPGFDDLIERLLYDIAITGKEGSSARGLENTVREFYAEKDQIQDVNTDAAVVGRDLLFSNAPPPVRVIVDDILLDSVFDWLSKHPDIRLQDEQNSDSKPTGQQSVDAATTSTTATPSLRLAGKRITASEDRIWHAIAGHGVDHKRLPALEFEILSVIAAHGPGGILQPYVTKLTGQDKRSVPKRTDALAEKGYIVKDTVIGSGQKTSALRLKKYARNGTSGIAPQAEPGSTLGSRPVIYYNAWFDATINLLKSSNDVVTMKDLRLHLGVPENSWARKVLFRCVRQVAGNGGCFRQLVVTIKDDDQKSLFTVNGAQRRAKGIQLIREPEQYDRVLWATSDPHKSLRHEDDSEEEFEISPDPAYDHDAAATDEEGELVEIDEGLGDPNIVQRQQMTQWTPDTPLTNLVQSTVDWAGQRGLTANELSQRLTGPFWRRPLDEVLLRMTDVPLHDRPVCPQHLSLIRDTTVCNKLYVYKFRTADNFEKAVAAGEASREAFADAAKSGRQKELQVDLDAWSFPKIPLKELTGRDGRATLAQCRSALAIQPVERYAVETETAMPAQLAPDANVLAVDKSSVFVTKKKRGRPKGKKRVPAGIAALPTFSKVEVSRTGTSSERKRVNGVSDSLGVAATENCEAGVAASPHKRRRMQKAIESNLDIGSADEHSDEEIETSLSAVLSRSITKQVQGGISAPVLPARTSLESSEVHRDKPARPSLNVKKRLTQPEEYGGFQAEAQLIAERQVMVEVKARKKRDWQEAGLTNLDGMLQEVTVADLPQDRITEIQAEIVARQKPGIYINPPGAKQLKIETFMRRGRPRNALIAVVKTDGLKTLPWFEHDGGPRVAPRPNKLRTSAVGRGVKKSSAERVLGGELDSQNNPDQSRKRRRTESRVDNSLAKMNVSAEQGECSNVDGAESVVTAVDANTEQAINNPPPATSIVNVVDVSSRAGALPQHDDVSQQSMLSAQTEAEPSSNSSANTIAVSAKWISSPGRKENTTAMMPRRWSVKEDRLASRKNHSSKETPKAEKDLPAEERFSKEYVDQHPEENFYHSSRGVWLRGLPQIEGFRKKLIGVSGPGAAAWKEQFENARKASTNISKVPIMEKATATQEQDLRPSPNFPGFEAPTVSNPAGIGSNAMPSAMRDNTAALFEQMASPPDNSPNGDVPVYSTMTETVNPHVSFADVARVTNAQATSAPQVSVAPMRDLAAMAMPAGKVIRPQDLVSRDYVDRHPEETFFHRGGGRWARGLPPLDFGTRTAVRGPCAEDWMLQAKTQADSKYTAEKAYNLSTKPGNLIVKLAVPPAKLRNIEQPSELERGYNRRDTAVLTPSKAVSTTELASTVESPVDRNELQRQQPAPSDAIQVPIMTPLGVTRNSFLNIVRPYHRLKETAVPMVPSQGSKASQRNGEVTKEASSSNTPSTAVMARSIAPTTYDTDGVVITEAYEMQERGQAIVNTLDSSNSELLPASNVMGMATAKAPSGPGDGIFALRQEIIMDAVRTSGGVFPGNGELWYVFATASKQLYDTETDRDTIEDVIKRLVGIKLKKLTFQFKNKKGEIMRRCILIDIGLDPNAAIVRKMQKRIIDAYPSLHLPSKANIDDDLRIKAGIIGHMNRSSTQTVSNSTLLPLPSRRAVGGQRKSSTNTKTAPAARGSKRKSRDYDLDDDDDVSYPGQTALQGEFRLDSYVFDPSAGIKESRNGDCIRLSKKIKLDLPYLQATAVDLKKQSRRSRDVNGRLSLDDIAKHQRNAASLQRHPKQAFHAPTGTFSTCEDIFLAHVPEQQILRGRDSLSNGVDQDALNGVTHFPREAQDSKESSTDGEDSRKDDEDNVEPESLVVKLKIHKLALLEGSTDGSGRAAATELAIRDGLVATKASQSDEMLSLEGMATMATSPQTSGARTAAGQKKRKYKSRLQPADQIGEGAQDSDGEFEPEIQPSPDRMMKKRNAGNRGVAPRRDRQASIIFQDGDRLIIAMALVSAVCGGLNLERHNWGLVAHAMSFRYDMEFLRRRWPNLRLTRKNDLEKIRSAIYKPFLQAYEEGKLPRVDFQNLNQTDWPALFEWVEENVVQQMTQEEPNIFQLPDSRAELGEFFAEDEGQLFELDRNDYFTTPAVVHRRHLAVRYTNTAPIPLDKEVDDLAVLKSLIRATAATKQNKYSKEAAVKRLETFTEEDLERGIAELMSAHILSQEKSGRQLPGRNYHLHKEVLSQFNNKWSKHDEHMYLRHVASAWQTIKAHFEDHDNLQLNPSASDMQYLVLTNMVAQGRLRVINVLPERKDDLDAPHPKLSAWTYGEKNYEMRKIDLSVLKYPIVYSKTAAYDGNHGLRVGVVIPEAGADGRTPFWIDIHGNLLEDHWDMLLRSVMHLLVFRSGLTAAQMAHAHNDKLWTWELEIFMEWMGEVGLAVRCAHEKEKDGVWKGGWRAAENWFCAFSQEIATWQAPAGAEVPV